VRADELRAFGRILDRSFQGQVKEKLNSREAGETGFRHGP